MTTPSLFSNLPQELYRKIYDLDNTYTAYLSRPDFVIELVLHNPYNNTAFNELNDLIDDNLLQIFDEIDNIQLINNELIDNLSNEFDE